MKKDISILKLFTLVLFASCVDKKTSDSEICKYPAIPKTHVKIYHNGSYVDSLITIIPLSESDSSRFVSLNFNDSTETELQKEIFQSSKVGNKTNFKTKAVKFWFTRLTNKTDTTKDFGLFSVLSDEKAIENCRFRFNSKNQITGVNTNPFLNETFDPFDKWSADTILHDE